MTATTPLHGTSRRPPLPATRPLPASSTRVDLARPSSPATLLPRTTPQIGRS